MTRARVRKVVREKYGNASRLAAALGISRQHVSMILRGEAVPSLALATALEAHLGIPARVFAALSDS